MAQDNAVIGLAEVVFAVGDAVASAARLAKFTARPAIETAPGMSVTLDRGRLTFLEPKDVVPYLGIDILPEAPAVVAVGLVSRDLARTREFLSDQGVALAVDEPNRLVIGADEALGCALILTPSR